MTAARPRYELRASQNANGIRQILADCPAALNPPEYQHRLEKRATVRQDGHAPPPVAARL